MSKIPIRDLREMMMTAVQQRGVSGDAADFIVDDYLHAELSGKKSHGVGKFLLLHDALESKREEMQVISESSASARIDAGRELGHIAALYAVEIVCRKAKEAGIGFVSFTNSSRYSRLEPIAKKICEKGLVAIVMNEAGPPAVVPPGGVRPVLGTNPVCFGFPGDPDLIIDFATSKRPWGDIRQAALTSSSLPEETFTDSTGAFTTDPEHAEGVAPFGGYKGFCLCLAIEILAGALIGSAMGSKVTTQYEAGCVLIAVDPATFGTDRELGANVRQLCAEIRSSSNSAIRIPGESSTKQLNQALSDGTVEISDSILDSLATMLSGRSPLTSTNKMN